MWGDDRDAGERRDVFLNVWVGEIFGVWRPVGEFVEALSALAGAPNVLCRHVPIVEGCTVRGFFRLLRERGIPTVKGVWDLEAGVWVREFRPRSGLGSP